MYYKIQFVEFPSFWSFGGEFDNKENAMRYWNDNANEEDIMYGEMIAFYENGSHETIMKFDRRE